jgi:P pilus assembly chaperone PapD
MPPLTPSAKGSKTMRRLLLAAAFLTLPASARAGIVLSQAVVDIQPGTPTAQDIEVWNDSSEVAYVVAQPSEIVAPGMPTEHRVPVEDPDKGGLLVTPQRLILQPQERKLVRVAAVAARGPSDRVWRVTIKPVAGEVTAPVTALKLLVGYDVLVMLRPDAPAPRLVGRRDGQTLTLTNAGNTNVEVYGGTQCATPGAADCRKLPSRRLYPGESWAQALPGSGPVDYHLAAGKPAGEQRF